MFDKFHEECGVVAIYGHPEASNLAYLGLYALQHRGQESAGICTAEGKDIYCHKSMGHIADIFTKPVLATLPGPYAIGHTRRSPDQTAGELRFEGVPRQRRGSSERARGGAEPRLEPSV